MRSPNSWVEAAAERGARCLDVESAEWIGELLARGHTVRIRATGQSMRPAIFSDDYVFLREADSLREGDLVLVLEHGHRPLVHRVVALREGWVQTRGDTRSRSDLWTCRECVVGRVVAVETGDQPIWLSTVRSRLGRTLASTRRGVRRRAQAGRRLVDVARRQWLTVLGRRGVWSAGLRR